MCKKAIFILILFNGYVLTNSSVARPWSDFAVAMKDSMKNCPTNVSLFVVIEVTLRMCSVFMLVTTFVSRFELFSFIIITILNWVGIKFGSDMEPLQTDVTLHYTIHV